MPMVVIGNGDCRLIRQCFSFPALNEPLSPYASGDSADLEYMRNRLLATPLAKMPIFQTCLFACIYATWMTT